jgi:hypothetical protein
MNTNTLNISVPIFYAYLREEFLYNNDKNKTGLIYSCVHGISSFAGKALGFHVMTDFGAHFSRLPIHSLQWKEKLDCEFSLDFLQIWDCFGYHVSVCKFDYLANLECEVFLKNKKSIKGEYMFTIDWFNNDFSEEISQYKCGHMIKLENGQFALQPNNRIKWYDTNFITKEFPKNPDFKVFNKDYICERGKRWVLSKEDDYYYDFSYQK